MRELTERARAAEFSKQFQTSFLEDKTNRNRFETLKKFWDDNDDAKVYRILRRIEIRTTDERGLQEQVHECLTARFLTNPNRVSDALRSLAEDSIHKTLDRGMLISHIEERGFSIRKLSKPDDAPTLVRDVTDNYLQVARQRLIHGTLIPRSTTRELLANINDRSNRPRECVLTGKAGGGKTGCVIECVEALRQQPNQVMVLAFRLDVQQVSSTKNLGDLLNFEESPTLVLATAAESKSVDAVLLIDQVDAVSTTSGRNTDSLDVVAALANEARGMAHRAKIHIVIVCREFDWDNDHRLRQLLVHDASRFTVTEFSDNEVKEILSANRFTTETLQAEQLEILRLPQNLKMFLDACSESNGQPAFSSPKELFDYYWREKRNEVNRRAFPEQDCWNRVIQKLCSMITASQQLFVPKEHLDGLSHCLSGFNDVRRCAVIGRRTVRL